MSRVLGTKEKAPTLLLSWGRATGGLSRTKLARKVRDKQKYTLGGQKNRRVGARPCKSFTVRQVYRDITQTFADEGRFGIGRHHRRIPVSDGCGSLSRKLARALG